MLVRGAGLAASMSKYLIAQIVGKGNIRTAPRAEVTEVLGEDRLENIVTTTREGISTTPGADALLLMIGATANTSWLPPHWSGMQKAISTPEEA
jgi:thioredoxin reductase (NADPH)